jgi:hypothetical protein
MSMAMLLFNQAKRGLIILSQAAIQERLSSMLR